MIDVIDPGLNQPQQLVTTTVAPVEPIDPESVSIEEQKLDDKQERGLIEDEKHRRRRKKDTLELRGEEVEEESEEDPDAEAGSPDSDENDGSIDVLI